MSKFLMQWDSLETVGYKGKGFYPRTDHAHATGRTIMRYASLCGLALSIFSLAMVVLL